MIISQFMLKLHVFSLFRKFKKYLHDTAKMSFKCSFLRNNFKFQFSFHFYNDNDQNMKYSNIFSISHFLFSKPDKYINVPSGYKIVAHMSHTFNIKSKIDI